MGSGQSQSQQCSCSKPGTISLTSLQIFSMVIPLSCTSILTAYSRNCFPFFQCITLWGISIYTTLCTWLDPWIWSFVKISEVGLFQFCTRTCKGTFHELFLLVGPQQHCMDHREKCLFLWMPFQVSQCLIHVIILWYYTCDVNNLWLLLGFPGNQPIKVCSRGLEFLPYSEESRWTQLVYVE
jgi:hypothetical protein